MANGMLPENVACSNGLVMMVKLSTNSPACVKPDSMTKLIDRHWGINPINSKGPKNSFSMPYMMKVSNANFTLNYAITGGIIIRMTHDAQSNSLIISVQPIQNGNLTMDTPRALIDSSFKGEDDAFVVLINGQEIKYKQMKITTTDRIETIPFSQGSDLIEIIGPKLT